MTAKEFNTKYAAFLEPGFEDQGLEFNIPEITEMLDKEFEVLTKEPGFTFAQIKLKFGMARCYIERDHKIHPEMGRIEDQIDEILKRGTI